MAVTRFAPRWPSLVTALLVAVIALPVGATASPASTPPPGQAQVDAVTAKIRSQASVIHELTQQLDEARLRVAATSDRLVSVMHQHEATVATLGANKTVLLQQALRAYMEGGVTAQMASMAMSGDVSLGSEYLRVASGDLVETGDKLHVLELNLRGDEISLQNAQHSSVQATAQLQSLRTSALATAASEQIQLDSLQAQLNANAQAAATLAATSGGAIPATSARPVSQGAPVNNGLVAVVKQASGPVVTNPVPNPVANPVAPAPTTTTVAPSSGGGHAGGVWLQLRLCESGDNYAENTGNGFYGAYQFSPSTWSGLGYPGRPDLESPATQDQAAMKLQAQSGWGQWPTCSAALGLS